MKKLLFIDRDGTIIVEPSDNFQVDAIDKLAFLPNAISALSRIYHELDYELVMVTNQDGLGTDSFPEDSFWPAHNLMMSVLGSEGIRWREVVIDRAFAHEQSPGRKPATGRVRHYLLGDVDLGQSFVIGDRLTDMLFARNLGAKGILLGRSMDVSDDHMAQEMDLSAVVALNCQHWNDIYKFLKVQGRKVEHTRKTNETNICIRVNLEGNGHTDIKTGLSFFDHMLDQLGRHGGIDLYVRTEGDLHIDEHHTIEDTALALGEALLKALGNKRGIERYGYALPMDDSEAMVTLDFGGRPWLVWNAEFSREKVGDMPTEMFYHFFKSLSDAARCNLHVMATGDNEHHKIEAIFKAFARAMRRAINRDMHRFELPTTKGTL